MSIGFDKNNNKLEHGDICKFKIKDKKYEGIIGYSEEDFAYTFEMKDNNFPSVLMNKVDFGSIEKIIGIYSTKLEDEYSFYRELWNKGKI